MNEYIQQDNKLWLSPEVKPRIKADKDIPGNKEYCLDEEALLKTEILPSDEDHDQLDALFSIIMMSDSVLGPRAIARLCKWHKVSCSC